MKKILERGLQYLVELGIRPAKEREGLYKQLRDRLGAQKARSVINQLEAAQSPAELYEVKNQELAIALTFSGAYDGEFYRKAFAWIEQHQAAFGREILEVGCDCGIMSCFLARMFPQAQITAIDRTGIAIEAARQLAAQLGVHNVTFLASDVCQLQGQQYDTVFSARTIHENISTREIQPAYELLLDQAILYGNTVADYAEQLVSLLKPGGHLVTIEKGEKNPMYLGWLLNLHQCGLVLERDTYRELGCKILGQPACFQAISAIKADNQADNVYAFWCSLFSMDQNAYLFHGWEAETFLQNMALDFDRLVEGYMLYNQDGERCGKYAVWTLKSRPEAVLYYQGNAGQITVGIYDGQLLAEIRQQLAAVTAQCRAQKINVQKLEDSADA